MKLDVASRGRLSADLLLSPLEPDDEPEPWGEEVADEDVVEQWLIASHEKLPYLAPFSDPLALA